MKNLLWFSVLFFSYVGYKAKKAYNDLYDIFKSIQIRITGIDNIRVNQHNLTFNSTIQIVNNSEKEFDFNSYGYLSIDKIELYYNATEFLGVAELNIQSIKLLGFDLFEIIDIPFTIPLNNLIDKINLLTDSNINEKLVYIIHGQAFGKPIKVAI